MRNKIILTLAVFVVFLVVVTVILYNTGILGGNATKKLIASYLDNNKDIVSWSVGSVSYHDNELRASDFKLATKQGVVFTFGKVNLINFDAQTRSADRLELFNGSLQRGEYGKVCKVAYVEMNDFQIKNVKGVDYPGFSSANANQISCAEAYSLINIANYASEGYFESNGLYNHYFILNGVSAISPNSTMNIPSIAVKSTYDRKTATLKSNLAPIEVENFFNLDMDVVLADFLPEEITVRVASDSNYDILQDVVIDFMRVKLVDKGFANYLISSLGMISGESGFESGKRTLLQQISASTAFEETFENGKTIQQALIALVERPQSVELIIDPEVPMNLFMGGDFSIDFIIDYNMSVSVNGGEAVMIR